MTVLEHRERGNAMAHYVIRVKGTLSRELTNSFPSLAVHSEPAQTVLHGYLHDQAELAGVFNHLDMLGIDILEVMHVPPEPAEQERTTDYPRRETS